MRKNIKEFIANFIREYEKTENLKNVWGNPIVKFGDATLPEIKQLRTIVHPEHFMPKEILSEATVIIAYFIPYNEQIGNSNIPEELNSEEWAKTYERTQKLVAELENGLISYITKNGYLAEKIDDQKAFDKEVSKSRWSHRHVAKCCGLGTFGINNMLITEKGCCGRIGSIVTNLDVIPDSPVETEYCLRKRIGTCGLCVKRCPSKALTETGYELVSCRQQCDKNRTVYNNINTCGKCVVGVPCTYAKP